ncbi:MAG: hypothetical protein M3445_02340 [Actinomycetota bacterium]|jgi:hypothetical protein|nr:hypothetical protein [Actinomycetota bacterium]
MHVTYLAASYLTAEEPLRDLPADPLVFGVIAFVILLVMLVALLMFGKGRPHS